MVALTIISQVGAVTIMNITVSMAARDLYLQRALAPVENTQRSQGQNRWGANEVII